MKDVRQGQELSVSLAIAQGILDSSKQKYRNNATGEVMSLDQAVKRSKYIMTCLIIVSGQYNIQISVSAYYSWQLI